MPDSTVPPGAVQEQLDRMLSSSTFATAERSSRLLRFIVEETLQGRADRLKDYTLGSEALGRGERFDPRTDPIARVEASRLRSRLELYYATEGASDPVIVSLPKGGYVPHFDGRPPATATGAAAASSGEQRRPGRVRWALAAAVPVAAALGVAAGLFLAGRSQAPEVRLDIATPATTDPLSIALSPDGRAIVFVASSDGTSRLWLRRLETATAQPLAGTDNASLPFWAPDSRSLAFFADTQVKRIDLETGLVRQVARAVVPAGGAWSPEGVILFPRVPDSPLYRAAADGSETEVETTLTPGQTGHRAPQFLPDGRHFVFYAAGTPEQRGVYVGQLGSRTMHRLLDTQAPAVFLAPDHLLYVTQGTLFAQAIDLSAMALVGAATVVAEGLATDPGGTAAALSASAMGSLAYRTGPAGGQRQFVWVDRGGRELSRIGRPEGTRPSYASASPDFRRIAMQRPGGSNTDIWLMDLDRDGKAVRFTSEPQPDIAPLWSPDGTRIVYSSLHDGVFNLDVRAVEGGASERLLHTAISKQATDWSRDGRWLLFRTVADRGTSLDEDIWAMPLDGDRQPFPVVQTQFEERDAQFAPDGRWIAYQSNESGRYEIYIRPFRREGERIRVSPSGGVQARWRSDGRELFYLTLDSQLVAVPITPGADGLGLEIGTGVPLFHAPVGAVQDTALFNYIVAPGGDRFLLDTAIEAPAAPITLVLGWRAPGR